MKKTSWLLIVCISVVLLMSFSIKNTSNNESKISLCTDSANSYLNGIYLAQSQASYTSEPFWGHIEVKIEDGEFTEIKFSIRDSSSHENVDSIYGINHYAGNPTYQQQCVNDGHGIEIYPQRLITSQNIDNLDAITGATWSYNIFKASVKEALKDAKISSSINNNKISGKAFLNVIQNPSNKEVVIEYKLLEQSDVFIHIYNNQGKLIKTLFSGQQVGGDYKIEWTDCQVSGIYYCILKTRNDLICSKIIML